jgi:signal transduction histidine kinase
VVEERLRIARELHDVVAHSMSIIAVQSGVGAHVLDRQPEEARKALAAVEVTSRQALTEVARAGARVEVRIEGTRPELSLGLDLSAYRIVQEALTNVVRHAGPATARVRIRYAADAVDLEVVDDGVGSANGRREPDSDRQKRRSGRSGRSAGHGILGMRERAALYGGTLDAGPLPGGGFRVAAHLPVEPSDRGGLPA